MTCTDIAFLIAALAELIAAIATVVSVMRDSP